jgi:Flp pilus assembly protein TadG
MRSLRTDRDGAVFVEFLIAFMPLFLFFSSLVQLIVLETADIVTKHAATVAARAAIVVLPDDPQYYDSTPVNRAEGRRLSDIQAAARVPLTALDPDPTFTLTFPSAPGASDNRTQFRDDDMVRVRIAYAHRCGVPIGNVLVCGAQRTRQLTGEAAMPNQGANYDYASAQQQQQPPPQQQQQGE